MMHADPSEPLEKGGKRTSEAAGNGRKKEPKNQLAKVTNSTYIGQRQAKRVSGPSENVGKQREP